MNITQTGTDGLTIFAVEDPRIDAAVAVQFKDYMRAATKDAQGRVLLDLSRVSFVDSSGLGALVACLKQMPPGSVLEVSGLTRNVEKVFQLTRMNTVFRVHDTVAHAVAAG